MGEQLAHEPSRDEGATLFALLAGFLRRAPRLLITPRGRWVIRRYRADSRICEPVSDCMPLLNPRC